MHIPSKNEYVTKRFFDKRRKNILITLMTLGKTFINIIEKKLIENLDRT